MDHSLSLSLFPSFRNQSPTSSRLCLLSFHSRTQQKGQKPKSNNSKNAFLNMWVPMVPPATLQLRLEQNDPVSNMEFACLLHFRKRILLTTSTCRHGPSHAPDAPRFFRLGVAFMVQQLTQDSKSAGAARLCRFAVANVRAGSCRLLRRLTPPSPAFLPVKGRTPFSGEGGNVSVEALWGTGLMCSRFIRFKIFLFLVF